MATSAPAEPSTKRGGRVGLVIIGIVVAVAAAGWAFVMANVGQTPGIATQTITFNVLNDASVQIRYSVAKPKDDEVRCLVDAFDKDFTVVGKQEVTVPRGTGKITRLETLQTTKRATGARVKECRKV